ncbi:uncharacterized protein LOC123274713 isoform X2 [Cotesia glomerata]|uniref:uncharacterized protein LOC123274713 isoform X2 n=1 Tax=Cotesia glomerata TaxID=32391 RepID=UPI001D032B33|nr:uncharacterized protein LOC123274713 isoform X2 [Cotesia glomerata]
MIYSIKLIMIENNFKYNMKIKKVPGLFPGTWKYFIGDYTFHKDYQSKSPRYTCTSKRTVSRCPVVAKKVGDDYKFTPIEHTHPKPPKCKKNKLTKKIKHLAAKTFSTSTTICNELNEDIKKSRLSPTAVKICVSRTRKSLLPEAPKVFTELKDTLKNYSKTACIFRGEVMCEDGSAIILSDKELIEHIGDVDEIQIDRTYENVPVDVPFKQLLIFHLRKNNIGLPSIFVMCNSTSGSMYSQLWSNLIDRVPSIQENLKSVVCDYDPVLMSVTKSSLGGIQLRGSWFSYIRMTCRLWRSMGLNENLLHDVLRYTWLIILLPAERFKEAIHEIIATIKDTIELYDESEQDLNKFIHSLEAWLLPQAESISKELEIFVVKAMIDGRNYKKVLNYLVSNVTDMLLLINT